MDQEFSATILLPIATVRRAVEAEVVEKMEVEDWVFGVYENEEI